METNTIEAPNPKPLWKTFIPLIAALFLLTVVLICFIWPPSQGNGVALYLETIISNILLGGMVFWAIKRDRISREQLGFSYGKLREALIMFIIAWVVILAIAILIILTAAENKNVASYFNSPWDILEQWLFVGMAEELFFRGYVLTRLLHSFRHLTKSRGICAAVVCSSVLFAVWHIPNFLYRQSHGTLDPGIGVLLLSLGYVFICGLLFSYIFLRTRNIIFCGLFHGSGNAPLVTNMTGDWKLIIPSLVFIAVIETAQLIKRRRQAVLKSTN
jgi:membrane protease YdiL (CAAX protease family)